MVDLRECGKASILLVLHDMAQKIKYFATETLPGLWKDISVPVMLTSSDGDVGNGVEENPVCCKFHLESFLDEIFDACLASSGKDALQGGM